LRCGITGRPKITENSVRCRIAREQTLQH